MLPFELNLGRWRLLAVVAAVIFVAIWARQMLGGDDGFTATERAQVEFANAHPEALLPELHELPQLPWDLEDCSEDNTEVVGLDYEWEFDPIGADELEGIDVAPSDGRYSTTRVFCYDNEDWAMYFVLNVPDDKDAYSHWRKASEQLSDRSEKSLELTSEAFMEDWEFEAELLSAEWLPWGDPENLGRGAYYLVSYGDRNVGFYDYDFTRGMVNLSFHMSFHENADVHDVTMEIASNLDRKVRESLDSILDGENQVRAETEN